MCRVYYPYYMGCGCTFEERPANARFRRCRACLNGSDVAGYCTIGLVRGNDFAIRGDCAKHAAEKEDGKVNGERDEKDGPESDKSGGPESDKSGENRRMKID